MIYVLFNSLQCFFSDKRLYAPLYRPGGNSYDPLKLPLRSHDRLMAQAKLVTRATNDAEEKKYSQMFGIKGVPILATLSSLSFPRSFPYDFMHLVWENVIKTLILLWCGKHKGMDEGDGCYELGETVLDAIGNAGKASGDFIPSCFGPRIPHIVDERYQFIADTWSTWTMSLGPVLLRSRFRDVAYYTHFIELVALLKLCLQFQISSEDIDTIETGMAKWVEGFEEYVHSQLPWFHVRILISVNVI